MRTSSTRRRQSHRFTLKWQSRKIETGRRTTKCGGTASPTTIISNHTELTTNHSKEGNGKKSKGRELGV